MGIKIFWDARAPPGLQRPVARTIAQILNVPVDVEESRILINGYNQQRAQHDSRIVLDRLQLYTRRHHIGGYVLLVIPEDLFEEDSDFVFGLARDTTGAAVLSTARLANEYYGRTGSDDALIERISKEGSHELGHLMGLSHCRDHECVMFQPKSLDELDGKKKALCPSCGSYLDAFPSSSPP
jgi:archaemetzincin